MKPFRTFLILSIILFSLGLVAFLFPLEGVQWNSFKVNFPSLQSIFQPQTAYYADITQIVEKNVSHNAISEDPLQQPSENDTIMPLDLETIKDASVRIANAPESPHALDPFFAMLHAQKNKKEVIRILHYGDSQIEGGRITDYLRSQLQSRFGGTGQGQISFASASPVAGVQIAKSKNWISHSIISPRHAKSLLYGAAMSFLQTNDSVSHADSCSFWVHLSMKSASTRLASLFCGSSAPNTRIVVYSNDSAIYQATITECTSWTPLNFTLPANNKSLKIATTSGVVLYGISFQGNSGLVVDNIPLRGSSGQNFSDNNAKLLTHVFQQQKAKLLILQFGVNAVPEDPEVELQNFHYYEKTFEQQLRFLKSLDPEMSVLVVSVSDRSRKNGEHYETNPNVLKIRDAQRKAAFRTGCAYWDLFEAMGGTNSMPGWVLHSPPLANPDFIHFNAKGSQIIAEMLYKALIQEYVAYVQRKTKDTASPI